MNLCPVLPELADNPVVYLQELDIVQAFSLWTWNSSKVSRSILE
jgi:hypothetical protein